MTICIRCSSGKSLGRRIRSHVVVTFFPVKLSGAVVVFFSAMKLAPRRKCELKPPRALRNNCKISTTRRDTLKNNENHWITLNHYCHWQLKGFLSGFVVLHCYSAFFSAFVKMPLSGISFFLLLTDLIVLRMWHLHWKM